MENLLFELSNEDRMAILYHLQDQPLTQSSLAEKLEINRQEIGRHIKRLFNVDMIYRLNSGEITLSEYGETVILMLTGLKFITSNSKYFQTHKVRHIPECFFSRINELSGSTLISDPMAVFQNIQNMSTNAEEYIWRMTDKHLNIAHPFHQAAVERGVEFRLIEPINYIPAPGFPPSPKVVPSESHRIDEIPLFLAISEKQVAGIGFPLLDGSFDYHCFTSKDPSVIKWSKEVFQYYWDTEKP